MTGTAHVLFMGFGRQELIAAAGIAGAVVFGLVVLVMLAVSVLPAYSESWAERLGTTTTTPSGADPAETIPGREEPIPPEESGRGVEGALEDGEDDGESSSATPEPEIAGEEN